MNPVFQTFGATLFAPVSFLGHLLNQFLLSPWGLVVPMALLITFVGFLYSQKAPEQVALFYAEQLETCSEEELPRLLALLLRMEDAGVPGLVKGLTSSRESVFTACRNILHHEFDRWLESEQREHHFLVFSKAIARFCDQFPPTAQAEAMRFVDQIMRIRSSSHESTTDRLQTMAHCEQILSQLESARRRRIAPQDTEFRAHTNTVASLNQRTQQPVLFASNGKPFVPTSARNNDETLLADANNYNPFSIARADRLVAHQQAQRNNGRSNMPERNFGEPQMFASFSPPPPSTVADIEEKFAQNSVKNDLPSPQVLNMSEDYRNQKLFEANGTFNSDIFLTPEVQSTPLDRVPNLPTTQLMRLLHHPQTPYVESARRTLLAREGFQESHLKLAWRLYHPIPAVRQEIVAMLPNTANVQPSVWLSVLLNDPDNEVRFRAASFLATTSDPALRRLLIDSGKRDSDARIVNLADRLIESQKNVRR